MRPPPWLFIIPSLTIGLVSAQAQLTPQRDLSGFWIGSGTLTSEWQDQRCDYRGGLASVEIWLAHSGTTASGGVKISMPRPAGAADCPPLSKSYTISGTVSGTRFTFDDPAGNTWRLNFTSSLLGGRVDYTAAPPNPNEALAVGTSRPDGATPLTRLRGTVHLRRQTQMDVDRLAATAKTPPQTIRNRISFGTATRVEATSIGATAVTPSSITPSRSGDSRFGTRSSSSSGTAQESKREVYYFQLTELPQTRETPYFLWVHYDRDLPVRCYGWRKNRQECETERQMLWSTSCGYIRGSSGCVNSGCDMSSPTGCPYSSPPATSQSAMPQCKLFGPYESLNECSVALLTHGRAGWVAGACSTYRPYGCSSGGR